MSLGTGSDEQVSGPLERYFQSGLEMFKAGNFAQAEVQFERALQLNRRHNESPSIWASHSTIRANGTWRCRSSGSFWTPSRPTRKCW